MSETARPAHLPVGRWLGDFQDLSAAEQALVAACAQGQPWAPRGWDEKRPQAPTAENTIRAGLIRFLLLGGDAEHPVHELGVMIGGAWIRDELNLYMARCDRRLALVQCYLVETPNLSAAHLPELGLSGSQVPGLSADRLTVTGALFLDSGFSATGEVRLLGAKIGGNLDCSGGTFRNAGGDALIADSLSVGGGVFLRDGFSATGEVRLPGGKIGGNLECSGGTFRNEKGVALSADGLSVGGGVFLSDGFSATGEVRLLGARIGGNLSCTGGTFRNEKGDALSADGLSVDGDLNLRDGFSATGAVRLLGARVGSNLDCSGGTFRNEKGVALSADGLSVGGGVFLSDGFSATGEVRLPWATTGGNLSCTGGTFRNEGRNALSADGLSVAGDLNLRDRFSATGAVRLLGARVRGNLECRGGTFDNKNGVALNAESLTVTGVAQFKEATVSGGVNLSAARVGTLVDDPAFWKEGGHVLDGFHYDRIIGETDYKSRIAWLNQQHPDQLKTKFKPQPWEQLITVLRAMGHREDAARVAIAKQDHMRKIGLIRGGVQSRLHWVYGWLAGYGHRPLRTVFAMLCVWAVCSVAFYVGRHGGYFGPANPIIHADPQFAYCGAPGEVYSTKEEPKKPKVNWTATDCNLPAEYTTLQPALYSLDLILPLVDLQQDSDWAPMVATETGTSLRWGHLLRGLMWFEILFGWGASLMLVAVLSRLVEKD